MNDEELLPYLRELRHLIERLTAACDQHAQNPNPFTSHTKAGIQEELLRAAARPLLKQNPPGPRVNREPICCNHCGKDVSTPDDWKPGDRVRELEKAGALIAAEIDRILRLRRLHTPTESREGRRIQMPNDFKDAAWALTLAITAIFFGTLAIGVAVKIVLVIL